MTFHTAPVFAPAKTGAVWNPWFRVHGLRVHLSFAALVPRVKICILGAGISGVTLARLLAADGHAVVVLEKADRAGGLCRSRQTQGFTWDEAGGHILFSKDKAALAWQKARCGGDAALGEIARQTRILWHDRFVPYPFENGVGHLTKEAIVDCIEGYVEAYVQRKTGVPCPANFKDWILWRMGGGFARHFMFPYNEKIWDCDLATMSSAWVAGRVPEAPLRDVLSSAVGVDTQGYTHQSVFWFPKHGGFEALVRGTVQGGGFALRTGTAVENVRRTGTQYHVNGEAFDLVVNTVPLPQIERTIEGIPDAIRADIRALVPISLVNVIIGVKTDRPIPPYSWIYLPFAAQGLANRVTYFSNYSPHNAPPGHASFMAEVTHRGDLTPDRAFVDELVTQLARCGLFARDAVVMTDCANHEFAYIDQNLAFPERIARVRAWFDSSGYITFGRFGRYEYHNSDQCIARAMEVHKHVTAIAKSGTPARPVFG
jgi:protoporphyrinogen oxidase